MARLRDLGLSIGTLEPGPFNAITDVSGVAVGHRTLIEGDGPLVVGRGPVRTGVTVILPRPVPTRQHPLFAGAFTLNGNGEFTGLEWVRESGLLTTPIALTNTHSVGVVRDAVVAHELRSVTFPDASTFWWSTPLVAETYDGLLSDAAGQHVTAEHVFEALESAGAGHVEEGNVGGGTGVTCHGFKGGIGTSSRVIPIADGGWTVGVLVQANYGSREDLRVNGVPVGQRITANEVPLPAFAAQPAGSGSIIIIIATDAPLLPDQCRRLAKGGAVGLARVGGGSSDSSGDIMFAFATGNTTIPPEAYPNKGPLTMRLEAVCHQSISPLLVAVSDATEEAILNALLAADTMTGRDGFTAHRLEPDRLLAAMNSG
jgi:D-aminopeptidase